MTFQIKPLTTCALVLCALTFFACNHAEDPGPLQATEKEYTMLDFDRIEMGDAFNIDVTQGEYFKVSVRGDRRNIDDLEVIMEGTTLVIRFEDGRNRKHDTHISITMPALRSANFSGASDSRISGFHNLTVLDLYLSGASVSQLDVNTERLNVTMSGASYLNLRGTTDRLDTELSGASVLKAFTFPATDVNVHVSGASDAHVTASNSLNAEAAGASIVLYRGNPVVTSKISGASTVRQE